MSQQSLVVTGVAHETDFSTGQQQYLLVLNRGTLRLPISAEDAEHVIRHYLAGVTQAQPQQTYSNGENGLQMPAPDSSDDYSSPPNNYVHEEESSTTGDLDDDGVPSI